jgi:hypothetical protein
MKFLFVIIFYGILYIWFENWFNWFEMDFFDKKKSWSDKLQFRPSNPASLWHTLSGGVVGGILYLFTLIPFPMHNVFIFILVGLLGGALITGVELGLGLLLFEKLKIKKFWDYSNSKPWNYKGYIDLWHSLTWIGMTYLVCFINFLWSFV